MEHVLCRIKFINTKSIIPHREEVQNMLNMLEITKEKYTSTNGEELGE